MRIARVDERDNHWEVDAPTFRVYFFSGGDAPAGSWTADTYDVDDTDVLEVIRWSQEQAGDTCLYAVALVGEDRTAPTGQRRGLTWLVGTDANGITGNETAAQSRAFAGMQARRGAAAVDPG